MAFELQRFGTLGGRAANIYARVSICVRVRVKVGQDAAAWFISDLNVFRMRNFQWQIWKPQLRGGGLAITQASETAVWERNSEWEEE